MRVFKCILSILLCFCVLVSCTSKNELSAKDIAEGLKSLSASTISWIELDKSKISTYFGFTDEKISDFKGYINSAEENFDMIAVFKFEDNEVREDIMKGIGTMTQQMSETYNLANKSISDKINSHIIAERDGTVILCIMEANEKVSSFITEDVGAKVIN